MERPVTASGGAPGSWPGRSGVSTTWPAPANRLAKRSKTHPPQKAPWIITTGARLMRVPRDSSRTNGRLRRSAQLSLERAFAHLIDQRPESRDHLLVNVALERDDRIQRFVQLGPAPSVELRLPVGGKVDLDVLALEDEGEPHLLLPAPALADLGALVL